MTIASIAGIIAWRRPIVAVAWNPGQEASLRGWWDMSNPNSFTPGSGGNWAARYGGAVLVPAGAGPGPSKITNGQDGNNQHSLSFTGMSQTALRWNNPNFSQCIALMVYRYTVIGAGVAPDPWYRPTYGVGVQGWVNFEWGGGFGITHRGRNASDYNPSVMETALALALHSDARLVLRRNGTELFNDGTSATGTVIPASEGLEIFPPYPGGATNFTAQLACVAFFDASGWSNLLAQKIEGFICHQGIGGMTTAKLPAEHPYKNEFPS